MHLGVKASGQSSGIGSQRQTGMVEQATKLTAILVLALSAAGCASVNEPSSLNLPEMPSLANVSAIGASNSERASNSPTELYARIGRGAMACWFGANGPLKLGYIFHAEAEPASRGGKAEIVIHARELGQPNPRGPKAYRVNIVPVGETASVQPENLRMPEAVGAAMTADVERWSKGESACSSQAVAGSWSPQAPETGKKTPGAKTTSAKSTKTKALALKPAKQ